MEDLNINDIWSKTLELLKGKILDTTYNAWILPLVPHSFEDSCFCVLTGQSLAVDILSKNKKEISSAISQVCGKEVLFQVVYDEELRKKIDLQQKKQKKEEDKEYIENYTNQTTSSKYDKLKQMQSDCNLNLKYKFENFVVGESNKFAYAAAIAVAEKPGKQYNPLFIYGGSGLGKTHLLQAIGHYILLHKTNLKVKYITAEAFINDFVKAIMLGMNKAEQSKKMNDFHNKYRNIDVLLIDDIQLIEGKRGTEDEIFNTFNILHNAGKQIVFTSDRAPEKFENSPDRIKSRFQQGLLADIQVPDIETRMAILAKLAQANNIQFPSDVIAFLASVYNKNIRELEGAFNRISAFSSINNLPVNIDTAKKLVGYRENRKPVTMEEIVDIVAEYFDISVSDIKGRHRDKLIAKARNVSAYLIRELTDESYSSIGAFLNRKHSTIMSSYDSVKKDMAINTRSSQEIHELIEKINSSKK